jgi:hypothetical protein
VENFIPARKQVRNDTCGLYSVWNAVEETGAVLGGHFSKRALKLRHAIRQKGGLDEVELRDLALNLSEHLWASYCRAVSDAGLKQLLSRGSVLAHVDGNHWVRVTDLVERGGKDWVRILDSGRGGYYDQLLSFFIERTGADNVMIVIGKLE